MDDYDFEIERTLCQLPQVHVFKIPVRMSAEGHRAADWPKDPAWSGKLKITSKGKLATITLFDDANPAFAQCIVSDDSAIERTLDSGRYFVLRITNNAGRHAFIGIAFNERNDAFDFNVALQEHKKENERELVSIEKLSTSTRDLSLKEGEKIKINIAAKPPKEKKASSGGGLLAPPSGGLLAKPPRDGGAGFASPVKLTAPAPATNSASVWDDFGSIGQPAKPTPAPAAKSDWDDFGSFGATPSTAKTTPKPSASSSSSGGDLLDLNF